MSLAKSLILADNVVAGRTNDVVLDDNFLRMLLLHLQSRSLAVGIVEQSSDALMLTTHGHHRDRESTFVIFIRSLMTYYTFKLF